MYRSSPFERFSKRTARATGHPLAFAAAFLIIVIWVVTGPIFGFSNTWQLVINTATTIVTFLLVALLQNSQRRNELAMNAKLDALADGLADLMEGIAPDNAKLQSDMRELRTAVGLEKPT
jgi:low affinity Fe/Cu permease